MKIFDVHTHVWPDAIAPKVVEALRQRSERIPAFTDGTAKMLRDCARDAGYTGWLNCPVVTKPGQARGVNEKAATAQQWPALSMGGVHPEDSDIEGELQRIIDLGLRGLKLHPEYQQFAPLEKRVEPIWNFCENHSMPVIIHAGIDIGFQPPFHSTPADFAELKRRHPGLILICAHLGGWLSWDSVQRDLVGHDVYFDTAFATPYMSIQQFESIIKNHGADKILYGTDSPWMDLNRAVKDILDLNLPETDKQKILWDNANTIWKLDAFLK